MHHRVASQRGVVRFDVELESIHQAISSQKVNACRRITVVLVLGRFFWFWLDQKSTIESNLVGVGNSHVEELTKVINLPLHVGVVQIHIAFATAPENIVLSAETHGDFHCLFHLRRSVSKNIGVATR